MACPYRYDSDPQLLKNQYNILLTARYCNVWCFTNAYTVFYEKTLFLEWLPFYV